MADFDWDALPDAAPAAQSQPEQGGFDFNALPDADQADLNHEKYGSTGQMLKTGAEQFISGATLGGSKIAETKLLGVKPEDIIGREQENPTIATGANIAGTGALIYGTGGLGSLAEGAGLTARLGVAGVEGAIIGGVNQASDEWSQDKALDAGKIASSAGIGALLGIGGAGITEGLGASVSTLGKFDKFMNSLPTVGGEVSAGGIAQRIAAAYQLGGESNASAFIKKIANNFQELKEGNEFAIKTMKNMRTIAPEDIAAHEMLATNFEKQFGTVSKIGSFFKDPTLPENMGKIQLMNDYVNSSRNLMNYSNNQSFIKGYSEFLAQNAEQGAKLQGQIGVLNQIKQAKKLGINNLIFFEALQHFIPTPALAGLYAVRRYLTSGGASQVGVDLQHAVSIATTLAEHAEAATSKVNRGAAAIFSSRAGQNNE